MHGTYPSIALELLQMRELDQRVRRNTMKTPGLPNAEVEVALTTRLKQILHQIGWPTISKVGKAASSAAWLLAQHADSDLSFQIVCLSMIKPYGAEEVSPVDIAYLDDRVSVRSGRLQQFGTQCRHVEGVVELWPVADPKNLDARRETIGLESSAEYVRRISESRSR